ncbi:MAG: type I-F CRISPR-associated protein Csy1 [Megasphaera sp.]|jgi:CRISPR-associated protein Csy1|nr:type I-F CRISPR-associated protein Csy1 [Megasphaera sp.]MCH4187611.1 type I-F CRISPR-associated protein Csy1 [Megasphaera sp.]
MSIFLDFVQTEADKKKQTVEQWLLHAADNASKCTWTTHCGRFTNPSINGQVSLQVVPGEVQKDGYVYTANVRCKPDVITSSAAYLQTAKLLFLKLEDGESVFTHLQENSEWIRQDFSHVSVDYETIRQQFLQAKGSHVPDQSDERLRQIYFPVGVGTYHLLSVMPASGMLMEMKYRIRKMEHQAREARNKKGEKYGQTYERIQGLTEVGMGGTKPQNISVAINNEGGRVYMLPSEPPQLQYRNVVRPHRDFFVETLKIWNFRESFEKLHHEILLVQQNNIKIRDWRDSIIEEQIIDEMFLRVYQLRELGEGWSNRTEYMTLPQAQKIWLDDYYRHLRKTENTWLTDVAETFSYWAIRTYERLMKKKAFVLGPAERQKFKVAAVKMLKEDREADE